MVEVLKWLGLVLLAVMVYGAWRSTPPKTQADLPDSWIFWVGFIGCILWLITCYILKIVFSIEF